MPEIKNLKKAAKRIQKACKKKEKIILYGDSDLDGISATVIMKETIQTLGGNVAAVFFPDRENDGYGITEKALKQLTVFAPALFISLDLGIGNIKEAEIAKKMGFELIIVDHHQLLDKTPKVSLIVDPKQKGDRYPFKEFAATGLSFKLSEEILGKEISPSLRNSFLELTAVATIADMMPQTDDNKILIEQGLASLRNTLRPGLKVFYEILGNDLSSAATLQKIISSLNISEATDDWLNETYMLLTNPSLEDSKKIAQRLIQKAEAKQFKVKQIVQEVETRIKNKLNEKMIFEGDSFWPLVLAGSVASNLCNKYGKPVFIYKKGESESYGSVRTPKNINSVDAMSTCADLLITFGGHPAASGFRIKNENLLKFKEGLTKYFNNLKQ